MTTRAPRTLAQCQDPLTKEFSVTNARTVLGFTHTQTLSAFGASRKEALASDSASRPLLGREGGPLGGVF